MEYRIEQLAQQAGVPVDTIRFYQGKGLLDPPRREGRITWYGEDHLARLRRVRGLQQRGFTLNVIRRFLAGELVGSDEALVEAVTERTAPRTVVLDELAERSGIAAPILQSLVQSGLLVPSERGADGEDRYPSEDVRALAAGLRIVEAGIPLGALLELGAAHARAVDRTARGAVDLFDEHVRKPLLEVGGDPARAEEELVHRFAELLEASGLLVRHHFERSLLRAARERIEAASPG
ncbi:MAG: MerR family transcriptional regulator [Candidatus Dormibacteraceae bacterium]